MMQYEPETICPEIAVVETVANGFTCSCPPLQLVPSLCTHCRPITGCDAGVSVTIFTAISPVFDEEKVCARALPGWTVPANGSTWFCDGSTMPPQLMVRAPARARTHAADTRKGMSRFYTEGAQLRTKPQVARGSGTRRFEQPQARDHQTIGLAGERGREDRVTLGVARELLRQRDQVLALSRRTAPDGLLHGGHS